MSGKKGQCTGIISQLPKKCYIVIPREKKDYNGSKSSDISIMYAYSASEHLIDNSYTGLLLKSVKVFKKYPNIYLL